MSSSLIEEVRSRVDPDFGFDFEIVGYKFAGAPKVDVERAIEMLELADQPCPTELATKAMAELSLRTKSRSQGQLDLTLTIRSFVDELAAYPSDVVIDACKSWSAMSKWFPSWCELKDLLDYRVKKRRAYLDALIKWRDERL